MKDVPSTWDQRVLGTTKKPDTKTRHPPLPISTSD